MLTVEISSELSPQTSFLMCPVAHYMVHFIIVPLFYNSVFYFLNNSLILCHSFWVAFLVFPFQLINKLQESVAKGQVSRVEIEHYHSKPWRKWQTLLHKH